MGFDWSVNAMVIQIVNPTIELQVTLVAYLGTHTQKSRFSIIFPSLD